MSEFDRADIEAFLSKAEENLAEALELASGLKETPSEEVLSWVIEHILDGWADVRRARRTSSGPSNEAEGGGEV